MRIEYWQSNKNGKWYFHVKARNGRILASSQGYRRRENVRAGISSLLVGLREKGWFEVVSEVKK